MKIIKTIILLIGIITGLSLYVLAEEYKLTRNDNGKSFNIKTGDSIILFLNENPTTGFSWSEPEYNQKLLKLISNSYERSEVSSEILGAGGVRTIKFSAIDKGKVSVKLVYRRPWKGGETAEEFTANFKIGQDNKYASGKIVIEFNDDAKDEEIKALMESYKLKWEPMAPKMMSMWINYKPEASGNEGYNLRQKMCKQIADKDKQLNGKDYIVLWAEPRENKILVQFNLRATKEKTQELIGNFEELIVESSDYPPKIGTVKVADGEEQKWVEIFKKEKIVKNAELIGIEKIQ